MRNDFGTRPYKSRFPYKAGKKKGGSVKKQGYKAREDESLGMRTGKESGKKQSMKDRRDESYGKWGKRPNQRINKASGGRVMGRGQGKVMRDRPTFMISMKD